MDQDHRYGPPITIHIDDQTPRPDQRRCCRCGLEVDGNAWAVRSGDDAWAFCSLDHAHAFAVGASLAGIRCTIWAPVVLDCPITLTLGVAKAGKDPEVDE